MSLTQAELAFIQALILEGFHLDDPEHSACEAYNKLGLSLDDICKDYEFKYLWQEQGQIDILDPETCLVLKTKPAPCPWHDAEAFLLGNHEEMLLQALESDSALRAWLDFGGEQSLLSYPYEGTHIIDPAHVEFIQGCQNFFETDGFIFTHADYDPNLPMDKQPSVRLRWEPVERDRKRPHVSGRTVVVGHIPQTSGEVLNLGHLICIDTDCSHGRVAHGVGPQDRADHPDKPGRGSQSGVKVFEIKSHAILNIKMGRTHNS